MNTRTWSSLSPTNGEDVTGQDSTGPSAQEPLPAQRVVAPAVQDGGAGASDRSGRKLVAQLARAEGADSLHPGSSGLAPTTTPGLRDNGLAEVDL